MKSISILKALTADGTMRMLILKIKNVMSLKVTLMQMALQSLAMVSIMDNCEMGREKATASFTPQI